MAEMLNCYYSLVQYCPDSSRLEAVNVGVVLACPREQFVDVLLSSANDRVRRLFGRDGLDLPSLNDAKRALTNRIRRFKAELASEIGFSGFAASRGNDLTLTPPRPMRAENPETALQQLFDELVGGRRQATTEARSKIPALARLMEEPAVARLVQVRPRISVPLVGLQMHADYAFQNGRYNLVRGQVFRGQPVNSAMRIAIEGHLLFKHPLQEGGSAQLIIVHQFEGSAAEERSRVSDLFDEYKVRHFDVSNIADLKAEILANAHL
jgi:hypothetical protein